MILCTSPKTVDGVKFSGKQWEIVQEIFKRLRESDDKIRKLEKGGKK